jgi:hypothetical protein
MHDDALTPDCRISTLNCGTVCLLHSALKVSHLIIAVRSMSIFELAIRGVETAISFDSVTSLRAGFSKIVKSSSCYFTPRGSLFEATYIFDARLYKCVKLMRGALLGLNTSSLRLA